MRGRRRRRKWRRDRVVSPRNTTRISSTVRRWKTELAQRDVEPEDFGAGGDPWVQAIEPELVDTSEYKTPGPWNICFSNAAVDNPWRVVGWQTMQEQVEALGDEIADFNAVDAEASDDKQISDIQSLTRGDHCDALIVSPNTTATLTPAVEQACDTGIPVIVFDRGVDTDCPVTFIKPIGGYAFGADAAEFLVDNVDPGGKILALRILPGVDVLETRWSAAQEVFADSELEIVGDEQTEGDAANTKQIVSDYIAREGELDGIWMDAGATERRGRGGVRGCRPGDPPDHRRGSARLPAQVAGGRPDRDRARLLELSVADADHRGDPDPQRRGGPEGVDPPAGADHPGRARGSRRRQRGYAGSALRHGAGARTCPVTPRTGSNEAESQYLSHREAAGRAFGPRPAAPPGSA